MKTILFRQLTKSIILSLSLVCGCIIAQAQVTPQPTPSPSPSADDILKNLKARPLPPMPDLRRIGVDNTNTLTLSMNDAIRRALENNNNIEIAKDDVRINEQTLLSLEGIFDPVFTFNPKYTYSEQPQASTLGGAGSSGSVISRTLANDTQLTKFMKKGGGNYTFFFNSSRLATGNSFSSLNPSFNTDFGVTFTQPLWRGRKIDNNRRQIQIQKKRLEQTDADFRRTTIDIISQVQRAYWDLVFALRDQQNKLENLNLTRENLRQVEAKIEAGAVAPLNRAEVQTELANRESDLLLATQSVSISENTLKSLLYKDSTTTEWTSQITPTDEPVLNVVQVSVGDAIKDAIDNRPELRRLKLDKDINGIDVAYFSDQTKPQINFTTTLSSVGLSGNPRSSGGSFTSQLISTNPSDFNIDPNAFLLNQINIIRGLLIPQQQPVIPPNVTVTQGTVPSRFVGGYGRSLTNALKLNNGTFEVGVTISFPFRNTTAKANLAGAKIQQERLDAQIRSQEQTIVVEVRNAVQAVETARLRLQASRTARENAEIQLAGEQKLFQVGRSTTFLLFQRENALAAARNAEIRAMTDYNKALADLQRATSTTLSVNNVTIQSPTEQK